MELIKFNPAKGRAVYRLTTGLFRKYWYLKDYNWVKSHVEVLNKVVPDYVVDFGENELGVWADITPLVGTPANTMPHTDEFMIKIYNACLKNIKETSPYVHGDWVLSNMFVDGSTVRFCDWDNVGVYPLSEIREKLLSDLESAFGPRFKEIINDSSSI